MKFETHERFNLCTMAKCEVYIRVMKLKATKIEFQGPFEEVMKIASPKNYWLYGILIHNTGIFS